MSNYSHLKVAELKILLEKRGLTKSGKKADLIARLDAFDEKSVDESKTTKKFRVIRVQHLAGADMMVTLFIENSKRNAPQIDHLVDVMEHLDADIEEGCEVTRQQIDDFFSNPVSKLFCSYTGCHDTESTYILEGKMYMPAFDLKSKKLESLWNKTFSDCKYPSFLDICDSTIKL